MKQLSNIIFVKLQHDITTHYYQCKLSGGSTDFMNTFMLYIDGSTLNYGIRT